MAHDIKYRIKDLVNGIKRSILSLPTHKHYTEVKDQTYKEITGRTDEEAIAYDWQMVGGDFPIGK